MSEPTISVVMATYNGERYLVEQLESIRRQTRLPDELVIGDDASTDSTVEIVQRFEQSAPFPVVLLRHAQTGLGDNFLQSLEASQGDLVAFSDQDDVWLKDKLKRCSEALTTHVADLVVHGRQTVGTDLRPLRSEYWKVRTRSGRCLRAPSASRLGAVGRQCGAIPALSV